VETDLFLKFVLILEKARKAVVIGLTEYLCVLMLGHLGKEIESILSPSFQLLYQDTGETQGALKSLVKVIQQYLCCGNVAFLNHPFQDQAV
jgi:hypothetical protein